MEKGTRKINFKVVAIVMVIAIVLVSLLAVFSKNAYRLGIGLSKEDRLALINYNEFTENDYKTQSDNVRFLAFFERDLDKDGYSERYDGTIKDMSSTDTLYLDINVAEDGTLKNGKVTFSNDSNFKYKMAMQKDAVLSKNYVSDNVKEILFNDIGAGTRELINGTIHPNTRVDGYYSKVTQIRLTGTYVPSNPDEEEIEIDKTITLTVDWYGNTATNIKTTNHSEDKEWFEETETVSDPNVSLSFDTEELLEQLIIKNASVTVTMPSLKGYYPEDIEATGVERISSSQFVISRDAIVDEEENITTPVSRQNHFYIKMKYPEAAYKTMFEEWVAGGSPTETLMFNIKASYTGVNNPNFDDAISYDTETATVTVKIGADDDGVPYPETYFQVNIPGNELERKGQTIGRDYRGRWVWTKQYAIDKGLLLDAWQGKNDGKFTYEVGYRALYWDNGVRLSNMRIEMEPEATDKIGGIDAGTYGEVYAIYSPMLPYLLENGAEIYIYDATGYELTDEQNSELSIDERIELSGSRLIKSFTSADSDIINRYLYTSKANPYVITPDNIDTNLNSNELNQIVSSTGRITDVIIDIQNAPFKSDINFYIIKNIKCYPDGYRTNNNSEATPVIAKELIDNANNVRAYARANYEWVGDDPRREIPEGEYEQAGKSADNDIIDLINKSSVASIYMPDNNFEPGSENTNKIIKITAGKYYFEDATWKDGIFVVEVPESIINMEINSITASNGTTIKGWSFDKEDGKYYLKIITTNEEEQNNIEITIDAEMVVDPRPGMSTSGNLNLYYENKEHKYYYEDKRVLDNLDINDNTITEELVGFAKTELSVASPSSIVTFQTVSNYDDNGSITVAPNIADISKSTRSAEMNLYLINGYSALVSGTKILGRVPFENNKFVLSEDYIGSTFSATMSSGITVPAEISANTVVYYSEVGEPAMDTTLEANGWKLASEVTDWSKIKSFLIDCSAYSLRSGENYIFTYNVTVPAGLEYNDVSYGTHAVFYNYHAENGILPMETEPTKVGIKVARTYNFEGIKFKEETIRTVADATYKLSEFNVLGEVEQEKSMVSNGSGVFTTKRLYVNAEYTLQETDSPANYLRNSNVIRFKVVENEDLSLSAVVLSSNGFRDNPTFTNTSGVDILQVEVEDAPKYQLNITYVDTAVNAVIPNAIFNFGEDTYVTNNEGKASILRLSPNHQYSITETKVDGCAETNHTFNLTRTDDVYELVKDEEIRLDSIENDGTQDLIQVNVTILKPGAPRYNLEIVKVEKDNTIEDLADMIKLPGAVFSLTSTDNSVYLDAVESNENAVTSVAGLYQYSLASGTDGEYTLQEQTSPNGYILNQEEITFVVKTINDELKVEISNRENLTSIKDVQVDEGTVRLIIQDEPYFRLTKKDSRTNEPLEGVKFAIYELNDDNSRKDFAKDINGQYIGEQNEEGIYEVVTNAAGIIQLPIRDGKYVAVETEALDGYIGGLEQAFEIKNGQETTTTPDDDDDETYVTEYTYNFEFTAPTVPTEDNITETIQINTIEDLVDLSNAVAAGNTYANKKIVLMKDLDFKDATSYTDSTATTYGDINGNGDPDGAESLLTELTKSAGFVPIGSEEHPFSGVFDGNNKTLSNLTVSRAGGGLFGYLTNAVVKNLNVSCSIGGPAESGVISYCATGSTYIDSCTMAGSVGGSGNTGGIVCYAKDNTIIANCTKTGTSGGGGNAGGIAYTTSENTIIYNCTNAGGVSGASKMGGIVSIAKDNTKIVNCTNTGVPSGGNNTGGIVSEASNNVIVANCTNTGSFSAGGKVGGIVSVATDSVVIYNCLNTGTFSSANRAGIVDYAEGNIIIANCTNRVENTSYLNAGIVQEAYGNIIIANCNNEANLSNNRLAGIVYYAAGVVKLYNCHNKGSIGVSTSQGAAGLIYACFGDIELYNCTNTSDATISGSYCGGLIAGYWDASTILDSSHMRYNTFGDSNPKKLIIVGCKNEADVSVGSGILYDLRVGIATKVRIIDTENKGNLSDSNNSSWSIPKAGIIGEISSYTGTTLDMVLKNVKNEGSVTTGTYAGGIIGQFDILSCNGNIKFKNVVNSGDILGSAGYHAGFIGYFYFSGSIQIDKCYNSGNIINVGAHSGGFIGWIEDANTVITNSYNTGAVIANPEYEENYEANEIGGLIGDNYSDSTLVIANCYNAGNVTSTGNNVGGIVGYSKKISIYNSYNTGTITGVDRIGGIIGQTFSNPNTVNGCYNTGNIIGLNSTYGAGGIIGHISNATTTVTNCYNKGKIEGKNVAGISGYDFGGTYTNCINYGEIISNSGEGVYAGGISSYGGSEYHNCYNYGNITFVNTRSSVNGFVGGIAAYSGTGSSTVNTNLYNKGNIFASNAYDVGGIMGYQNYGAIEIAYNEGKVTNIVNKESTNTSDYTGGIVGHAWGNIKNAYNEGKISGRSQVAGIAGFVGSYNIENVYNTGDVISTASEKIGPIIALTYPESYEYSTPAVVSNAYYLDTAKLTSLDVNDEGTPKTWEQMLSTPFYNTLNVDNVWVQRTTKPPTFNLKVPVIGTVTEVNLLNDKEEYIIATQVDGDGGTISGQSDIVYEKLSFGENSKKAILAAPKAGFVLTNLSVNGEAIDFTTDSEGDANLPVGFFRNIDEDKLVVASFTKQEQKVTVSKVDEDTNEPLTGARFKISNYNDNWDEVKASMTAAVQTAIGELTQSTTEGAYPFVSNGSGGYVSTNTGIDSSISAAYIPIDLRNVGGTYNLRVNAQASSRYDDYGYVTLTETTDIPEMINSSYVTNGQLGRVSGTSGGNSRINDERYLEVKSGKLYYLHFVYKKNESYSSGNDTFTIQSVSLECSDYSKVDDYFELDAEGKAELTIFNDKVYITELEAPEGYLLDSTIHEYTIDDTKAITITNKAQPVVTAHYYLKENGEYTTKKVAPDDIYKGNIGDEYKAEIKSFTDLELEKDVNGEYVVPLNASGVFTAAGDEVNFYYVAAPVDLTIHHYVEGTETKLAADEVIETESQVVFDENEDYKYDVVVDEDYVLADNTNYRTLVASSYALVNVGANVADNLSITDTLTYNTNAILTYTYEDKDFSIKTKVQKHAETVINTETEQEEQVMVEGGTISGQDMITYETVGIGEDSVKDIVITANEGYKIKSVTLSSIPEEGEETTTVLYGENAVENGEVTCTGTEKLMTLSKFENVQADKIVTVEFTRIPATVLVHHIKDEETEDYATVTIEGIVGQEYTTEPITIDGYVLDMHSLNTSGIMTEETINVYYYYVPGEPAETKVVEKYTDINTNETVKTEDHNGHVGDPYTITASVPTGYVLIETDGEENSILPTNAEGTMTADVIEVEYFVARIMTVRAIYKVEGTDTKLVEEDEVETSYEGKTYTTTAKTFEGYTLKETPANASGTLTYVDSTEIVVTYEYVANPVDDSTKVVEKYVDVNTNQTVKTTDHNGHIGEPYSITASVPEGYVLVEEDKQGNSILPTNTTGTMTADVIEVIYKVAREAKVTVSYVNTETNTKLANDVEIVGYEGKAYTTEDKDFEGYVLVEIDGDAAGNMLAGDQEVTYKYAEEEEPVAAAYVRVIYIDTETKAKISEDTIIEGYEGKPYVTTAKEIEDYEILVVPVNAKGTMTVTVDGEGNVVNETLVTYIYIKRAGTKVVEKYVDVNTEEVVESKDHEGKVGDLYEITPKVPNGYKLIEKDKDGKDILPENTSGRMTEEVIEVVYYVAKDAKVKVKYVVKYGGKDVAEEEELEGYEGKEYSVDPKDVEGYELIEIDGKPEGTMKAGENVVTFYYAKKVAGIIPQTGINVFFYTLYAIAIIAGANAGIIIFFRMRKK